MARYLRWRVRALESRLSWSADHICLSDSILTVFLMLYRVKGAILIGILLTSIISWPRSTAVTYFPHTEAGDAAFDFFKQVVTFWPLKLVGNALDVSILLSRSFRRLAADARVLFPVQLWQRPCMVRAGHLPLRRYPR